MTVTLPAPTSMSATCCRRRSIPWKGVRGGRLCDAKKCSRRRNPKSATSPIAICLLPAIPTTRPSGSDAPFARLAVIVIARASGGAWMSNDCERASAIQTGFALLAGSATRNGGSARATTPLHGHNAKSPIAAAYAGTFSSVVSLHSSAIAAATQRTPIE